MGFSRIPRWFSRPFNTLDATACCKCLIVGMLTMDCKPLIALKTSEHMRQIRMSDKLLAL